MDEIAKQWLEKLVSGDYKHEEYLEFQQWLQADKAHQLAFQRARHLDALIDSVADFGSIPHLRAKYRQTKVNTEKTNLSFFAKIRDRLVLKSVYVPWSACATLLVVCLIWVFQPKGELYQTRIGEQLVVSLTDKTRLTLNTDTQIHVNYDSDSRVIVLRRGHAYFEVASDADRPFIVNTKQGVVTALGTAFSVKNDEQHITVVLNEGQIKISSLEGKNTPESPGVVLSTPGEKIMYSSNEGIKEQSTVNLEETMGWTKGTVVFKSAHLRDVVKELNRYSEKNIIITDESLKEIEIDAIFYVTDIDNFFMALKSMLDLQVIYRRSGNIELSRNK